MEWGGLCMTEDGIERNDPIDATAEIKFFSQRIFSCGST